MIALKIVVFASFLMVFSEFIAREIIINSQYLVQLAQLTKVKIDYENEIITD